MKGYSIRAYDVDNFFKCLDSRRIRCEAAITMLPASIMHATVRDSANRSRKMYMFSERLIAGTP